VSQPSIKVVKPVDTNGQNRVSIRPEVVDRKFLTELRRALLQQLSVVEKQLGIQQRCPHCAFDLSK